MWVAEGTTCVSAGNISSRARDKCRRGDASRRSCGSVLGAPARSGYTLAGETRIAIAVAAAPATSAAACYVVYGKNSDHPSGTWRARSTGGAGGAAAVCRRLLLSGEAQVCLGTVVRVGWATTRCSAKEVSRQARLSRRVHRPSQRRRGGTGYRGRDRGRDVLKIVDAEIVRRRDIVDRHLNIERHYRLTCVDAPFVVPASRVERGPRNQNLLIERTNCCAPPIAAISGAVGAANLSAQCCLPWITDVH